MIRRILATALLSIPAIAMANSEPPAKSGNFICHGGHYRCAVKPEDYKYHQFGMRKVPDFAGYSDLLPAGPPIEHYQSFLTELDSRRADTNAVAFWSDAMARADKARVWGAFVSTRSELPKGQDAQLIGMEIDVLNDGLPGVYPNQSKVGLQIVGFGKTNTNAIEVLSQSKESGRFANAFNVQPHAVTEDGAIFGIAPQNTGVGLNMLGSQFKDSAVLLSPGAPITFRVDGTHDAKVYRDTINGGHLVLQAASAGLRITNSKDSANVISISEDGWLRSDSLLVRNYAPGIMVVMGLLAVSMLFNFVTVFQLIGIKRRLAAKQA